MGITPKNWEKFFYDESEGLGTLYERIILHKLFERIIKEYKINNVLECPSFGMTGFSGINSWFFAKHGLDVCVADDDSKRLYFIRKVWRLANLNAKFVKVIDYEKLPFENDQFDLVWNFSSLWYLRGCDLGNVLNELVRVCRKVLLIINPNKNLFYILRKFIDKNFFIFVNESLVDSIRLLFERDDIELVENGYIDTPPWIDIPLKLRDVFRSQNRKKIVLPEYYQYLSNPELERKILRLSFLEFSPNFFKKRWSHHVYYIFQKSPFKGLK